MPLGNHQQPSAGLRQHSCKYSITSPPLPQSVTWPAAITTHPEPGCFGPSISVPLESIPWVPEVLRTCVNKYNPVLLSHPIQPKAIVWWKEGTEPGISCAPLINGAVESCSTWTCFRMGENRVEPKYFVGFPSDCPPWVDVLEADGAAGFVQGEHSEQVAVQGKVTEVSPPDTREEEACSGAPKIRFK